MNQATSTLTRAAVRGNLCLLASGQWQQQPRHRQPSTTTALMVARLNGYATATSTLLDSTMVNIAWHRHHRHGANDKWLIAG